MLLVSLSGNEVPNTAQISPNAMLHFPNKSCCGRPHSLRMDFRLADLAIPCGTSSSRPKRISLTTTGRRSQQGPRIIFSKMECQAKNCVYSAQRVSFGRGNPAHREGAVSCCVASAAADMAASDKPSGQALIAVLVACVGAFSFGYHIRCACVCACVYSEYGVHPWHQFNMSGMQ